MASIILKSFYGGMNLKSSPVLMKLEESRILKNADFDEIGTLKKAKGYVAFGDTPNTNKVLGLIPFYKIGSTIERILLRDGSGEVRKYNFTNNTWDAITGATGLSTTKKPVWIIYANQAIRFNGVDAPKKYDGTTFANLGGNPFNGDVAVLFKDRIYVAGVSPNYSTVYYSKVGDIEGWVSGNSFVINQNDGDRVMGMKPIGDSLLIFKENSLWEVQVDNKNFPIIKRPIANNIGTTSQFSIVENQGVLYFFNRTGVYQIAGKYPELISFKIDPLIKGIQNPYDVFAWSVGTKIYFYVGQVKLDDRTFNNTIIEYDVIQDFWSIRALPHQLTSACIFIKDDNTQTIYLGENNGKTFEFLKGFAYDDKPIEFEYESPPIIVGDPNNEKIFKSIIIRAKNKIGGTPQVFYSIDDEIEEQSGGEINSVYKIIDIPPGINSGKEIKIRIVENSKYDMVDLYFIEVVFDEVEAKLERFNETK